MRSFFLLLGILTTMSGFGQIQQSTPNRVQSPEVHADGRVTFRVRAPQADTVRLTGWDLMSYLGKTRSGGKPFAGIPLEKAPDGVWSVTVGPLEANPYQYNFVVDGVRTLDPANGQLVHTSQLPHSLVEVPSKDRSAPWEARDVPHGQVVRVPYYSPTMKEVREVHVYTPPGYADGRESYPVLYLLHGAGEVAHSWSSIGRANSLADNALAAGQALPCLIVMPLGHAVSVDLPFEQRQARNTALFEQDLLTTILPLVEKTFRAKTGPEHRALAGLSMGGAQTAAIGLKHPEVFGRLGVFSAGIQNFSAQHADLLSDPAATARKFRVLYLGVGSNDHVGGNAANGNRGAVEGLRAVHQLLTEKGIPHTYRELPGLDHTWFAWRRMLYEDFLPALWR